MGKPTRYTLLSLLALATLFSRLAFAQHSDDFLVIEAEDGWSIVWDGNDGEHFDAGAPDDGGAQVPDNLALASNGAVPFGTSELDPARWDFHVIASLNNGTYGNFSSWIGADGDEDKFVGINLGGKFRIGRIAWGRDNGNGQFDDSENPGGDGCGGQCDDRWQGDNPYILQITTVPNANKVTPGGNPGRVLPGRPLIIRPADGFVVEWNGNDGEFFDAAAPPDGANVPDNLALFGTPFSSSDLGPELNIDIHRAHNITDGTYGNANSWISASGDASHVCDIG